MNQKTEVWKQASEVYEEISGLSVKQALAHVYGINNISIEVQKAVITLINSGNQASLFFEENIANKFNISIDSSVTIGQKLGEYELLELLGQGGMSQVFKAKRIESEPQKMVAIKVFSPKEGSKELLNHFIKEQNILAKFSHPGIVGMLHGGKTDDNIVYLVMELIQEAQPIDKYCLDHKLSDKQKIDYIYQCARALEYSHDNLIIHRDLKPDNILVNKSKQLKIVDFGIAKLINTETDEGKTTIMALTPSFAAPEQINSEQITVKSDVFSLAIVAITLMSEGTIPLPKDRMVKSCANDQTHLDNVIRNLNVDKDLKNILAQASQTDSHRRYANMHAFAEDLDNYLSNKPVNATSPSWFYRVNKFAKRRSALFATIMTLIITVTLGFIILTNQYQKTLVAEQKAVEVKNFMLDSFRSTNPNLNKGVEVTAKDLLKASAEKLKNETKLDKEIQFEILQTLGIAYGSIGVPDQAIDLLKKSLLIQPENSKSLSYLAMYLFDNTDTETHQAYLKTINIEKFTSNLDKARVLRVKAKINARDSEFDTAMLNLNKALELSKSDGDTIEEMQSLKLLAEFYFLQSDPNKGIEILKTSLKKVDSKTPLTLVLGLKSDLGTLYNDIGEYDLALIELKQSVEQIRNVLGDKNHELSKVLGQISGTYRILGQMDKAKNTAKESHQINLEVFGENNVNTAVSLNMLAVLSYQTGDIPTAITQMQKAIDIFEGQKSDKNTNTLELKTNLAALLNLSNRDEEALVLLREIYTKQMSTLGAKHDSTIYSQQILARTLAKLEQLPEALPLAENAAENAKLHLGMKNPLTTGALFTLARIYQQDNQSQKALDMYIDIEQNELIKTNNPNYPILLKSIADLYAEENDTEKAVNYYQLSIEHHTKIYSHKHLKTLNTQLDFAQFLKNNNQKDRYLQIVKAVKKTIIDEKIDNPEILEKLKM